MFLQAAGHADVVDPQEAAAGEGDIPGGVRREHGLRAPLEAGVLRGSSSGRGGEVKPRVSARTASGRAGRAGQPGSAAADTGIQNTAEFTAGRAVPAANFICGGPALGPPPAWPPPLGSPGAGGIARPLLPTLPPVNPSPGPGALRALPGCQAKAAVPTPA